MIYPLLPIFLQALGGSPAFVGLVDGLAEATASLLKLLSGYMAERTPRKKPMVLVGYGLAAVVRPLVALATAPWHVLAVRLTDRIGKGLRSSPRDVLLAHAVPKEDAGRAFGFHRAMDHAGAFLGPLLATALLRAGVEMRTVFLLAIVPGLLSVLAVCTVSENSPLEGPAEKPRAAEPATALPTPLRRYFVVLTLFCLGNSSDAFLLLRARDLGIPTPQIPLLWAAFHAVKVVSAYGGGRWSDRRDRRQVIALGWLLYGACYGGFALATAPWQAWFVMLVYGTYYGLTEPAEKALVKELAPAPVQGRSFGYYNFLTGASAVPAGLLTGWLWQTWGPATALWTGATVAAVAAVLLVVGMGPRKPLDQARPG